MYVETQKDIKVTLILTQEEAFWLKSITQNELHAKESVEDRKMRDRFFHALPTFQELGPTRG